MIVDSVVIVFQFFAILTCSQVGVEDKAAPNTNGKGLASLMRNPHRDGSSGRKPLGKTPRSDQGQQFYCEICKKKFNGRNDLKLHMNKHAIVRFQCNFCPKTFTSIRDRDRHGSIHTGIYKFSCEICGKGFNRNDQFNKHLSSHA